MYDDLVEFLQESVTPFHAAATAESWLCAAGFTRLEEADYWNLEPGKGYYTTRNGSSVVAWRVPQHAIGGWRIVASHSDSPSWKIKADTVENDGCRRLSVEGYGGMIMSTWLDRPLTVGGRALVKTEDGIRTEAYDPAKLEDPSLIIYHPVRTMGSALVVTNGDQTDTVCRYGDFRKGLMTREYEPDDPNWTPRISAILNADGSFELSILKRKNGRCLREFFCYEGVDAGRGYFISTYQGDGTPLPTFAGEPMEVSVPSPEEVWDALNEDNKVSLYANVNGEVKLFNKNLGD